MTSLSKFINLDGFNEFEIEIRRYNELLSLIQTTFDQHRHNFCEIYINIDGNVSFVVEDKIYPVSSGTVIITRPGEEHHCIYNGIESHRHYCIWIKCDDDFLKKTGSMIMIIIFAIIMKWAPKI